MPKLSNKTFTDTMLRQLKPRAQRFDVFDAALRGLGLRVSPSGSKSWFVMRRVKGKMTRKTLGRYPELTLKNAREQASDLLSHMAAGSLPDINKDATVSSIFKEWMEKDQKGNRSRDEVDRAMRVDVIPTIGHLRVGQVERRDINRLLDGIVARGAGVQANRILAYLKRMFNWARARDYLDSAPTDGVLAPAKEKSRDRVLSICELRQIWAATEKLGQPFGAMYQLLILTGQRRQEVAGARWDEFDLDGAIWTIPSDRAKNGQQHVVHLSTAAVTLLKTMPRLATSPFVFTTTGHSPVSGFSKAKSRLDELSGCQGWVNHDLRRSFATHTTETLGFPAQVVDRVLNHSSGAVRGVAAVYQKGEYLEQRRQAMQQWCDLLLIRDKDRQ